MAINSVSSASCPSGAPSFDPRSSLAFKFFKEVQAKANEPENTWYAGEVHGHSPTQAEKVLHFVFYGDLDGLRRRFREEHQSSLYVPGGGH